MLVCDLQCSEILQELVLHSRKKYMRSFLCLAGKHISHCSASIPNPYPITYIFLHYSAEIGVLLVTHALWALWEAKIGYSRQMRCAPVHHTTCSSLRFVCLYVCIHLSNLSMYISVCLSLSVFCSFLHTPPLPNVCS